MARDREQRAGELVVVERGQLAVKHEERATEEGRRHRGGDP
jgi:hypothetical protein